MRYKLEGRAKVCSIISSMISFLAAMPQWLVFTSCIDLDDYGITVSLAEFMILNGATMMFCGWELQQGREAALPM